MVQRQNIVDGLKLNINTELKNYLAKTQPGVVTPLAEPGYGYDDMIAEFQKELMILNLNILVFKKKIPPQKNNNLKFQVMLKYQNY